MKNLWGAFKAGVIVFYVYTFIKWYINMHFHKKWGWLFWLNTICAIKISIKKTIPISTPPFYSIC